MKDAAMCDFDICNCGDYRRDHVNGRGHCKLNWAHSFTVDCIEFRLSKAYGSREWADGPRPVKPHGSGP